MSSYNAYYTYDIVPNLGYYNIFGSFSGKQRITYPSVLVTLPANDEN